MRAKSHAQAYFACPLGDGKGHDTVDARCREQQCDDSENRHQGSYIRETGQSVAHGLRVSPNVLDRLVRIDSCYLRARRAD